MGAIVTVIVRLKIDRYWQMLWVGAVCLFLLAIGCDRPSELEVVQVNPTPSNLRIWWDKGYVLEEDEAIEQVVRDWEQKSDRSVQLSFYAPDEIGRKASRAEQAGNPPDVMFSSRAEYSLFAWNGELADVSDVIVPVKKLYSPAALKAAYLYNKSEQKRSYYGVPLHQATIHIFYWRDLLEQAGQSDRNIPEDWNRFWNFWQQAQDNLRAQQQDIYGLGLPMSVGASDTYYLFEQILEAHNARILDAEGQLQINNPIRQGIVESLNWYAKLYQQGYVPPTAANWLDPDNNRSLLNRVVIMTPNPTLSIPLALQQDRDTYQNKLGILEFPNKPNGQPMRHLVAIRQAVVFANSQNQEVAKEFLTYLIQPEVIESYLKSAGGRYLPVMDLARKDRFWTDPANPHLATATKTLSQGQTSLFYAVQNPAYSVVLEENVWGKALNRIVIDGVSSEQAADEAIARIEEIFAEWQ